MKIEAQNQILDKLDYQIHENVQEILEIRIPEAIDTELKNKIKRNNLWFTGAFAAAGGQFLRIAAQNWFITEITYPQILGMFGRITAGGSYAFTRLINVEDKNLDCGLEDFYYVKKSPGFKPLFHLQDIFAFVQKMASPYFAKNPLHYLQKGENSPKFLKTKVETTKNQIIVQLWEKNNLGIKWKYSKPRNQNHKESFASKLK